MMRSLEDDNTNLNGSSRSVPNGSRRLHKAAVTNAANGTYKPSFTNGMSHTNGDAHPVKPRPTYYGHDQEEVTRILIQTLGDLGYHDAAGTLSRESGYDLEDPSVAAFRHAVLEGEWNEAEQLLFGGSRPSSEGGVSIHGGGLQLADGCEKNVLRFWMRRQKYLELLEARDTGRALMVLRTELTPLNQEIENLHSLSRYLDCKCLRYYHFLLTQSKLPNVPVCGGSQGSGPVGWRPR
jgi:hypothetical protein